MLAAAAALAAPAMLDGLAVAVPRLTATAWGAIIFIGLSSGGGYVLWLWALANASATRVTAQLARTSLPSTWMLGIP